MADYEPEPKPTPSPSPPSFSPSSTTTETDTTTTPPAWSSRYTYTTLPWLGPDYTNGNISFETQFQDWQIENPAVVLQEALGEWWKKVVDGIHAEFGALPISPFRIPIPASHGGAVRTSTSPMPSSSSTRTDTRLEVVI